MKALRIVLFVIIAAGLTLAALAALGNNRQQSPARTIPIEYRIENIRGVAAVDITLTNATGGVEQHTDIPLPYSYTFDAREGQFVSISAQSDSRVSEFSCFILANGVMVKSATSSGEYAIVTCSGKLTAS